MTYSPGTNSYNFAFDYISKYYVKVRINNKDELTYGTHYTVADKTVALNSVVTLSEGDLIEIFRETPTDKTIEWYDSSILRAQDLNLFNVQLMHINEENMDKLLDSGMQEDKLDSKWDARLKPIKNLANPTKDDEAINYGFLKSTQNGYLQASQAKVDEATSKARDAMIQANRAYEQAENAKKNSTNAYNEANRAYSEAERAKGYADKAKTSEDNVSTMKTSVEATVTVLDGYKTTVASYRDAAAKSATNAANSASDATTKAYQASTSATEATNSATKATNSATEAANSAAEAKTYKDQAKAIVGGDFLTKLDASNTYLTQANASSTYLSKTTASQTYATSENLNSALTRLNTAEYNITSLTNNKADKTTVSTLQAQVDSNTNAITTKQPKGNYATVEYVDGRVANIVNSAPETLDTLNELATALGNDPNFATTVSTQIGQKANKTDVDSQIQDVNTKLSQAVITLQKGIVSSVEGKKGEVNLWDVLHRYGDNYVPADTSSRGWNNLGICIIYYTKFAIKNQPGQYGQLINIPASKVESMQIWVSQYDGKIYTRYENTNNNIDDAYFVPVGRENRVYLTNGAQIWVE